jgi:N-acetylneuraminic acid mutarotase
MEITWTKGVEMPETLEGFSAVAVPNRGIFIFGGVDNDGIDQNSLFQYSPTNKSWRKVKTTVILKKKMIKIFEQKILFFILF